jgi:hypothetical protein
MPDPTPARIERYDLDAKKQPVSEGYYAIDPRGALVLMPTTASLRRDLPYRLATQAEVDVGIYRHATLEDVYSGDLNAKQWAEAGIPGTPP